MSHSFLTEAIVFLTAAVLAVPISKRLGLGSVLGYLAAGSIMGPAGLSLIKDVQGTMHFAEFGVVFLLFIIGLELQPSRLWQMRKAVFGLGTAQILATTLVIGGASLALGLSPLPAFIVGFGLSLSSTAFALQLLTETNQLNTPFGQASFAILLFQDIAVIPLLAALPLLAPQSSGSSMAHPLIVAGVIVGIVVGGRYLVRPIFRVMALTGAKEIFTAASLLMVLGIAAVMQRIGVSQALGAFLAGVLLADSEYRHELEADVGPFKGLLLGLFFMSVGMSVDYQLLVNRPVAVAAAVLALLAAKGAVLFGIGRIAKLGRTSSSCMAISISQGGEFAFVLFGIATASGLLAPSTSNFLVLIVALSMAMTPVLVAFNERFFCDWLSPEPAPFDKMESHDHPVIIAGYGRVGQIPARVLKVKGIGLTALEHDPEHVDSVRRFGQQIYYGDASRIDLLEAAGAKTASIFILAIDDIEASIRTVEVVKEHFPHLKIFARVRNRQHAHELMDRGVTSLYRETYATSLEITHDVLLYLGFSESEATDTVRKFRTHDEKMLIEQNAVHKDEQALIDYSKRSTLQLAELFKGDQN